MLRRHWAAGVIFLVLAALLTNPLIFHVWNAVEDKQDALLNTWIMAWVGHAAVTDPLNLYNSNIFYPYSNTLAFSEVLVPQGLLALPFTLATDNSILGYNLVLLAMLCLNALAMYLLVLDWTRSKGAGWVAGAIYAFNPFNLGNLAQIQLLSLGWLPLSILYLRRLLNAHSSPTRRGEVVRNVILFALFFILQSLSSIYFALLAGLAVIIYVLWWIVVGVVKRGPAGRLSDVSTAGEESNSRLTSHIPRGLGYRIGPLLLSLCLVAAALTPFLLPYFSVQRELGFKRSVQDSEPFSANLHQFIEVSPQNVVYGKWLSPNPVKYLGGYPLDNLFPGFVALILGGIGFVSGRTRERWFLIVLLAIAFLLSLGPRLYVTADQPTGLALPYLWLYDILPLLQGLRAPVRFEALIMFATSVLAGLGMAVVLVGRWQRAFALLAVALVAVEYLAVPAANTTVMPVASDVPPVYKWLAQEPPGVVLQLPMIGQDPLDPRHADISIQYFSTYHWHPTPDGFSGFFAPRLGDIADELQGFPGSRAVSLLQALDVRYLILSRDMASRLIPSVKDSGGRNAGLIHLKDFGDAVAYRVEPPFFYPGQLSQRLYLPQPAKVGAAYTAYLILANSVGWPYAVKPTEKLNLRARWSDGHEQDISTALPLVTDNASVIPISLHVPASAGNYTLNLYAEDGALGPVNLSGDLVVGNEGSGEVVVPLQVELRQPFAPEYAAGATLAVPLAWQPLNRIEDYYSVSVRVTDEQGNKITSIDRQPRGQTLLWRPGSIVEDEFDLNLPTNVQPGQYKVELLMYGANGETSVLLLDRTLNPQETLTLGEFRVK